MANTNTRAIIERICNDEFCVVTPDVAERAITEIKELESNLAEKVLAEIARDRLSLKEPTEYGRGLMDSNEAITNRVRALFTWMEIEV